MGSSGYGDQARQLSTVKISSAVDNSFVLNVGEGDYTQMELQLYSKQPSLLVATTPENEVFRLDATGMLQASIVRKKGCVDVCVAGSKACGGL